MARAHQRRMQLVKDAAETLDAVAPALDDASLRLAAGAAVLLAHRREGGSALRSAAQRVQLLRDQVDAVATDLRAQLILQQLATDESAAR